MPSLLVCAMLHWWFFFSRRKKQLSPSLWSPDYLTSVSLFHRMHSCFPLPPAHLLQTVQICRKERNTDGCSYSLSWEESEIWGFFFTLSWYYWLEVSWSSSLARGYNIISRPRCQNKPGLLGYCNLLHWTDGFWRLEVHPTLSRKELRNTLKKGNCD